MEKKRGAEQDEEPKSEEVEETRKLGKKDAYKRGEGHLPPRLRDMKAEEILSGAGVLIGSSSGAWMTVAKGDMAVEEGDKAIKGGEETGGGVRSR